SPDELPSPGLPDVIPLPRTSLLVGRTSRSRNITPDIDCGSDSGVSRRQAQLTSDGRRWFVEDLESANGTFIGSATNALPEDPIPVGVKRELDADDRIYLGAWTRLVIREATEDEVAEF
ncbi:MAG: FHA domain-containing protein, partial [Microlunatus sp.]|nr:FHA domain-containing protein [Microlunatus sp.]